MVELANGSLASSSGHRTRRQHRGHKYGAHVHGSRRAATRTDRFVCVVAKQCVIADALTKVVMAMGVDSTQILQRWGASAYFHDALEGWQLLEGGAKN